MADGEAEGAARELDVDRETDRCQKEVTRFSEQHGDPAPAGPPVNGFGLDIVYELDGQTALPVSLTTMCLITFHCGLFANSCSASGPFILSPPPAADSHLPEPAPRYPCDLTTVPRRITLLIYLQLNLTIVIVSSYRENRISVSNQCCNLHICTIFPTTIKYTII